MDKSLGGDGDGWQPHTPTPLVVVEQANSPVMAAAGGRMAALTQASVLRLTEQPRATLPGVPASLAAAPLSPALAAELRQMQLMHTRLQLRESVLCRQVRATLHGTSRCLSVPTAAARSRGGREGALHACYRLRLLAGGCGGGTHACAVTGEGFGLFFSREADAPLSHARCLSRRTSCRQTCNGCASCSRRGATRWTRRGWGRRREAEVEAEALLGGKRVPGRRLSTPGRREVEAEALLGGKRVPGRRLSTPGRCAPHP
jgi:hypothetical protein